MSWLLRLLLALLTLPLQSTLLATQKAPNEETPAVAVIHGRVTSGFYGPLYDIAVILIDPDTPNQETVAAHTDADGFYTVTEAISNTWKIKFDPASSQFNAVMLPGYYKNALSLEEATPVTAQVGMVITDINTTLVQIGEVHGLISAKAGGAPVQDVDIKVFDAATNKEVNTGYGALVDSDDNYSFVLTHPGDYKVLFMPPDSTLPPGYVHLAFQYYPDKNSLAEAKIIRYQEQPQRIDVALPPGGVITGEVSTSLQGSTVTYPVVSILNEHGEVVQTGDRFWDDPHDPRPPDPEGFYHADRLPTGTYRVRFETESHLSLPNTPIVNIVGGQTIQNVNAKLLEALHIKSIATSSAAPNIIALIVSELPYPIVMLNGGQSWQVITTVPWVKDGSSLIPVSIALAPRVGGAGMRLVVAVPESGAGDGLYRSGDNGQSWAKAEIATQNDSPCDGIFNGFGSILTTVLAPDYLYVFRGCEERSHNLVSDNGGVTWRDETSDQFPATAAAPFVPSPLIKGQLYLLDGVSSYESTDNGLTWQQKGVAPLSNPVFDLQDPNFRYGWSTGGGHAEGTSFTYKGHRSRDGGITWEDWPQQPCQYSFYRSYLQLLADANHARMLYLRCPVGSDGNGLYRSDDAGDGWRKLADDGGIDLETDYGVPGRIFWARPDGLVASTDQGESWQSLWWHYNLPGYNDTTMLQYLPSVMDGQ